jgi:hypothetical protein
MGNLEASEVGHLHVFAFKCVGGGIVLLKAWNRGQPEVH